MKVFSAEKPCNSDKKKLPLNRKTLADFVSGKSRKQDKKDTVEKSEKRRAKMKFSEHYGKPPAAQAHCSITK